MHRSKLTLITLATSFALMTGASFAGTASGTLDVELTITAECKISSGPNAKLSFGSVGLLETGNDLFAEATIDVECTKDAEYHVGLAAGNKPGASIVNRKLTHENGNDTIDYILHKDAQRTQVWGDSGNDRHHVTGSGDTQRLTIFGMVNGNQPTPPAGLYKDTVALTVSY